MPKKADKMQISYPSGSAYSVGKQSALGKGVYDLKRPKSLYEVSKFRKTPFTERICDGCRSPLGKHWYLVFLNANKLAKMYCRRDGTAYYVKEKYPY